MRPPQLVYVRASSPKEKKLEESGCIMYLLSEWEGRRILTKKSVRRSMLMKSSFMLFGVTLETEHDVLNSGW